MKIVQIVPGTGGAFYCENCVRDVSLVKAFKALGHDVIMVPMYLPISSDDVAVATDTPVFFGAINTYLRQKYPIWGKLPHWMTKSLDSQKLFAWASKKAGSTRAEGLEESTLSLLSGDKGPHAGELDRLASWLADEIRPDIVHLSTALLIGLARRMRAKIRVPVVCSLQDEDSWIDAMRDPQRKDIWNVLSKLVPEVDAFISVSHYYADVMSSKMKIPPDRMNVVPIGIEAEVFHQSQLPFNPPVIGYVSRMSESLGLGLLVEAFIRLKSDARLRTLKLRATGGQVGDDVAFVSGLRERLRSLRMGDDVDFILDFDKKRRLDFLQSLSVFSAPTASGVAFGLPVLEAIASGVPVVQPDAGAFRELIEATGGGILYDPGDIDQYTDALKTLLLDPQKAREMGRHGRDVVMQKYTTEQMAKNTIDIYKRVKWYG
jgi:glycosyltransferase involved in cell wall biosynthesis